MSVTKESAIPQPNLDLGTIRRSCGRRRTARPSVPSRTSRSNEMLRQERRSSLPRYKGRRVTRGRFAGTAAKAPEREQDTRCIESTVARSGGELP